MAQRLRLMAEHFQDWPLWTDAGDTLREDWSCLPETLLDELAEWVVESRDVVYDGPAVRVAF